MIEIINKPLLLHLVGYLYYWQMGFNSVFKGLIKAAAFDCCRMYPSAYESPPSNVPLVYIPRSRVVWNLN